MSVVAVDPSPFDLAPHGGDGRTAALCLHGLTGTPYEVRPIAEVLAARGVRCLGPALPGHCSTPEELRGVDHGAWLDAARAAVEKLRGEHDTVVMVGVSMGGVASLRLAAEGLVDALAVIGTPLRLRPAHLLRLLPLVMHFHRYLRKRDGSDIRDPEAAARHPGYDRMPLRSVNELVRMQRQLERVLHLVTVPILVAHGAFDGTAHLSDAHRIAGEVSSGTRQLIVCERSGHVVPVDYDGAFLAEAIAGFFERSAAGG